MAKRPEKFSKADQDSVKEYKAVIAELESEGNENGLREQLVQARLDRLNHRLSMPPQGPKDPRLLEMYDDWHRRDAQLNFRVEQLEEELAAELGRPDRCLRRLSQIREDNPQLAETLARFGRQYIR